MGYLAKQVVIGSVSTPVVPTIVKLIPTIFSLLGALMTLIGWCGVLSCVMASSARSASRVETDGDVWCVNCEKQLCLPI